MKVLKDFFIVLIALGSTATSLLAQSGAEDRFERARLAFENGDWPTAITTYNALLGEGVVTWSLHFNLGKSYFKNNEPGPAIFHYERAQVLNPSKQDIAQSIAEAQEQFNVPPLEMKNLERWARWLTPNQWMLLLAASVWIGLATFLLPALAKHPLFDTTLFHFARIMSIGCAVIAIAGFALTRSWYQEAIVIADEAMLKLSPTENSPEIRAIISGEKMSVSEVAREHVYVEAADGSTGWVILENIERLWM